MHPALLPLARDNAGHLPRDALQWALDHWEEVGTDLLARLDAYTQDSDPSEAAINIAFFAVYLAAQMRDQRAFPVLCRLAESEETLDVLLGDGITEDLNSILINNYDGGGTIYWKENNPACIK